MARRSTSTTPGEIRAAASGDVISARTLVALGMPETTVYRRCRDGGPWQRLLPGIILLTTGAPSPGQLAAAAMLHCGPGAMLTGLEACRRHGIRRGPDPHPLFHVLVPHSRQVRSNNLMTVERSERMPAAVLRRGVPLAPVPRAVIDAARRIRSAHEVTELLSDAVQRGLCTVAQLAAELNECGRRGSATPRRVLGDVSVGVRSAAERDAKQLLLRSRLPAPRWNVPVHDRAGCLLGIADAWWDDVAMAWEINSYAWHLAPADYARETEKRAKFAAAGVAALPTMPTRLRNHGRAVLEELESAYAHALERPRPDVHARPS